MKKRMWLSLALVLSLLLGAAGAFPVGAEGYDTLDKEWVGINDKALDASLMSLGDTALIRNVFKKAEAGEHITIAGLGGSITFGSGMVGKDGTQADTYLELVGGWFRDKFPKAEIEVINCGLPATGSHVGIFNAADNLWQHKPDLLFIEYAVNEGAAPITEECCETLFRRCIANNCAVCYFFMSKPDGWNTQADKKPLGDYYHLPMVSYLNGLSALYERPFKDYDADGTHPNKKGQHAAGLFLINWLETAMKQYDGKEAKVPEMPARKYSDAFDYCRGIYSSFYVPKEMGSFVEYDDASLYGPFKKGWAVQDGGTEPIVFEVEAKRVYVALRGNNTLDGKAIVMVNDVPVASVDCVRNGEGVNAPLVFESDTTKKVKVSIKVIGGQNFVLSGLWLCY